MEDRLATNSRNSSKPPSSDKLTFVQEQEGQAWAGEMKEPLVAIKARVAQEQAGGGERLDEATRQEFERRYQRILVDR